MKNESKFSYLPDYLLQNYIIPFLNKTDLFFSVRPLNTEMHNLIIEQIKLNFSEKIMNRLQMLCGFKQGEDFKKQFEEKFNNLLSERNALFIISIQMNFGIIIKLILEISTESQVINLLRFFFFLLRFNNYIQMLNEENYDEIRVKMATEDTSRNIRTQIDSLLQLDDNDERLGELQCKFKLLDENYFMFSNEHISNLYFFLGKMIDFQCNKTQFNTLKKKIDVFLQKMKLSNNFIPNDTGKYNKIVQIIDNTKNSNKLVLKLVYLFNKFDIDNPLNDFVYQKLMLYGNEDDDYNTIKNRKLLTQKINRIEEMGKFYLKYKIDDNDNDLFEVNKLQFILPEFLFVLSMIKPKLEINSNNFILTYMLIKSSLN